MGWVAGRWFPRVHYVPSQSIRKKRVDINRVRNLRPRRRKSRVLSRLPADTKQYHIVSSNKTFPSPPLAKKTPTKNKSKIATKETNSHMSPGACKREFFSGGNGEGGLFQVTLTCYLEFARWCYST